MHSINLTGGNAAGISFISQDIPTPLTSNKIQQTKVKFLHLHDTILAVDIILTANEWRYTKNQGMYPLNVRKILNVPITLFNLKQKKKKAGVLSSLPSAKFNLDSKGL